ncbi:MAG: cell division protein SepF [Candidatus Aenigmatarchaeota archaeon]|nr:cell division protein SepF [Candidatus Aenigmarchaeota archaeon]
MTLFSKSKQTPQELHELSEDAFKEERNFSVAVETLKAFSDAERIQEMVREGKLVFLRIKEMRENDINELRRAVEKLKKTIAASDGDIVGVDEDVLIVCPQNARVYRG